MQTLRYFIWTLAALFALPTLLVAQPQEKLWQKLATFPHRVLTVHFLKTGGPPRIGFVGCDSAVYRTTDGGETWREASYVRPLANDPFMACDFTFKDSLNGWFSNWDTTTNPYYHTTDGGATWTAQSAPTNSCSAVYYNPSNGVMFLSGWPIVGPPPQGQLSCISTDEGNSWHVVDQINSLNGYAFLDGQFGVVTDLTGRYRHTTDGGLTWQDCTLGANEAWQPAADTTTHTIWAASEMWYTIGTSSDNGVSLPDNVANFYSTGTLRIGSCNTLYAQRSSHLAQSNEGIIVSDYQAKTWIPVADKLGNLAPSGEPDTRFFVQGSYIYAPSSANEIWRYIGDSTKFSGNDLRPQALSHELRIFANDCAPVTKPLYIQYLNDCTDAQLTSAQIDPPDRFQIVGLSLPKTVSGDFPITIEHDPLYHTPDSAKLYLTYHSHGVDSYDTVLLTNVIAGSRYTPRISLSANGQSNPTIKSGDTVNIALTVLDSISASLGVDSIGLSAIFDSTMLESTSGPIISPPFSLLREEHTLGTETLVLRVPRVDIPRNTVLATLPYRSYLTPDREAHFALQEIRFNDSVFNGCVATADVEPSDLSITVLGCGDSTARAFLRGESLIRILSVGFGLEIMSKSDMNVDLRVFNGLGQPVDIRSITLTTGRNVTSFEMLRSGFYTCEVIDRASQLPIATDRFVVIH